MSSRILFESLLTSPAFTATPNVFSLSSLGEYKAFSSTVCESTAGAYSFRRELSLAALVRRLLSKLVRLYSVLVRLYSVLVRRLSEGEAGVGRGPSRLDRLDCRRRGGGGGGGMLTLAVLSPETARIELRFDETEDVR